MSKFVYEHERFEIDKQCAEWWYQVFFSLIDELEKIEIEGVNDREREREEVKKNVVPCMQKEG